MEKSFKREDKDSLAQSLFWWRHFGVQYSAGSWDCGVDSDTTLTSDEVKRWWKRCRVWLSAGATIDGSPIVTENSLNGQGSKSTNGT